MSAEHIARTVTTRYDHPCWLRPVPTDQPVVIIAKNTNITTTGKNNSFIIKRGSLYSKVFLIQCQLDGNNFWYSPKIIIPNPQATTYKILPNDPSLPDNLYTYSLFIAILAMLALIVLKKEKNKELWLKYRSYWLLSALLIFHFLWIGYFIWNTAEWNHLPLDETQDFIDAKLILSGDITSAFRRTLGMAMLYIPFIWITDAKNIYDIAPVVSWFMTLLVVPAGLVGAFMVIKKISKSSWIAFTALMIALALPKVYLPNEPKEISMFGLFFLEPEQYILICYNQVLCGFNSMSDTLAAALMFCTLIPAFYVKNKTVRYITVSALYALTCLIRMNYVFMSPLLAYIFWKDDDKLLRDYAYTAKAAVMAIATFLLIYSPQLILNKIQNGGFFLYPYIHYTDGAGEGFELSKLSPITNYFMHIHYFYYAVFVSSCLLIKDSYKRNILILWVVPMTIFFCGFWLGQPFRFLLAILPGTIAALIILFGEMKESISNAKLLIIPGVLLAFLAFPALPIYGLDRPLPSFTAIADFRSYAAPVLCAITVLVFWKKKQWSCLYATAMFGFIFLSSSVWILFGLMLLLLGWAAVDFVREIIIKIKNHHRNNEPLSA